MGRRQKSSSHTAPVNVEVCSPEHSRQAPGDSAQTDTNSIKFTHKQREFVLGARLAEGIRQGGKCPEMSKRRVSVLRFHCLSKEIKQIQE